MRSKLERVRRGAPALLLIAALAAAVLLASDPHRNRSVESGDDFSWNHLALAENLSPEHGFASFYWRKQTPEGVRYMAYHRFPVLGHLLIKAVTLPFPDDAGARIRAARTLMLAFFAGAAALAWLALLRLAVDQWLALGAVLLAFSSLHALYYADMVATEGVVDLFAVMLAFHGVAVFAAEGRFGQLVVKVCAALLLGWHVLALVGPLAVLGVGAALWRRDWRSARRHFALGAVAVVFAAMLLGVNLARERAVLGEPGGAATLAALPSAASALNKAGVAPEHPIAWARFLGQQLHRMALASVPYAVAQFAVEAPAAAGRVRSGHPGLAAAGAMLLLATLGLAGRASAGRRLPLGALAVAGTCWALVMRHNTHSLHHDHEALFHVGLPLAFFALTLAALAPPEPPAGPTRPSRRAARLRRAIGVAAAAVFVASAAASAHALRDPAGAEVKRQLAADFDAISAVAQDQTVLTPPDLSWFATRYLLRGSVQVRFTDLTGWHLAEYAVAHRLAPASVAPRSLTQGNQLRLLYRRADYQAALHRFVALASQRSPIAAAGAFDLHYFRNTGFGDDLLYVRRACPAAFHSAATPRFFLHVLPVAEGAPGGAFENLDISADWFWREREHCYARRRLPDRAMREIRTGQFERRALGDGARRRYRNLWEVRFRPPSAPASAPRVRAPAQG